MRCMALNILTECPARRLQADFCDTRALGGHVGCLGAVGAAWHGSSRPYPPLFRVNRVLDAHGGVRSCARVSVCVF